MGRKDGWSGRRSRLAALDAAQMRSWSERRDRAEEDGEGQRFRGGGKVEERRTRE